MRLIHVSVLAFGLFSGCRNAHEKSGDTAGPFYQTTERDSLQQRYPEVPDAVTLLTAGDSGLAVYATCQQRYAGQLKVLQKTADSIGAKLVVTLLSPETGEAVTRSTQKGIPFILETAASLGIEAHDFMTPLAKYSSKQLTQMPLNGYWSAEGSRLVAALYQPVIASISHRSTIGFSETERPRIFGDLDPELDLVMDDGKGFSYQLITNKQGLRMKEVLGFPKTRQRILFLGDSQLYSPFLDNNRIFTSLLQQQFPDKEIANAGMTGYTLDDCAELLSQKAKYAEPDVIILVTNPNNIADFYFTQRNLMGRNKKARIPTAAEAALYRKLYQGTNK